MKFQLLSPSLPGSLVSILIPFLLAFVVESLDPSTTAADFVVIGGGTAGCTIAARLCQRLPWAHVVVLEQGGRRTAEQELVVKAMAYSNELFDGLDPELVKSHPTEPNNAMLGRRISMREGMTVGGSSNIALQWEIPLPGTVEEWGIDGLDAEMADYYYSKAAGVVRPQAPPVSLHQNYTQDALNAYATANFTVLANSSQIPKYGEDPGGETSYINILAADETGSRRSSYTSYLEPILQQQQQQSDVEDRSVCHLTLIEDATVTELVFSNETDPSSRVTAVKYVSSSHMSNNTAPSMMMIEVAKEVIVSAGPFGSPRLLQLNGIGPKEILEERGVPAVRADLPVGQKTQIRPLGVAVALYTGRPLDWANDPELFNSEASREQFLAGEGGPLGIALACAIGKMEENVGYHTLLFVDLGGRGPPTAAVACFSNPESFGNITIIDGSNIMGSDLEIHSNLLDGPDFDNMVGCIDRLIDVLPNGFPADFGMVAVGRENLTLSELVAATTSTS